MTKNFIRILVALLLGAPLLTPILVNAQTGGLNSSDINIPTSANAAAAADVNASAQTSAGGAGASVGVSAAVQAKMTKAKERADTEITRRIDSINNLLTRVQSMNKVSADFKTSINSALQAQVTGLGTLKSKIDSDTDEGSLKTDVQSVTASYRIYALVLPQVHIAAAADRLATIVNMLSGIGVKLQARLQTAQNAGADITPLTAALTDMAAKLADAQKQAQAAIDGTAALQPDGGDKTKMAANTAALKKARTYLQMAQQDLVAARKDVATILSGLKTLKVNTSASTTVQTQ